MVHTNRKQRQAGRHNGHHDLVVLGIAPPKQEGVDHAADDGAKGHKAGQNDDDQKHTQKDADDPPVHKGSQRPTGQDALSAPEAEPNGENMSNDGEAAAEHLRLVRPVQARLRRAEACRVNDPSADKAGQDRLADVDQQDQEGIIAAVVAVEIRQPGVAAALGADVLLADPAGDQNRAVEAAQQIADHAAERKP